MLTQTFIGEMKQRLEEEKSRLTNELQNTPMHTELGQEEDDQSNELQIDEVNQDVLARVRSDLEKIEIALVKIANGSYGTDTEGREIREDRLRALPWADKAL